jgi:hypothetical protein
VDQYATEVREIERRIQLAAQATSSIPSPEEPAGGVPEAFDEHIKLHFDLTALAFQADITRVATMLGARDLTGKVYPFPKSEWFPDGGTSVSFHGGSHHQDDPIQMRRYALLNRYHIAVTSYFVNKLKSIPDGDGSLLDHSLTLWGTNMGNSNQHQHYDVPHVLIGGANGQLKGGRFLTYPRHNEYQGDSTGRLERL